MAITRIGNGNFPPNGEGRDRNNKWEDDPSAKIIRSDAGINVVLGDVLKVTPELVIDELRKLDNELKVLYVNQEVSDAKDANNQSGELDELQSYPRFEDLDEVELLVQISEYVTKINHAKTYFQKKQIPLNYDNKLINLDPDQLILPDFDWEQFFNNMHEHYKLTFRNQLPLLLNPPILPWLILEL